MIQIYTGNGKGKTTAALGLALRAVGAGKRVLFVRFMKDKNSSELKAMELLPGLYVYTFGRSGFYHPQKTSVADIKTIREGLEFVNKEIVKHCFDVIVLDEINNTVDIGFIKPEEVIKVVKAATFEEIILTGRNAVKKLIKEAHLVTNMQERKHYFCEGIGARKGIEY